MNDYNDLIEVRNILLAWQKFSSGKSSRKDVVAFWMYIEDHVFEIYHELKNEIYTHSHYDCFVVQDTKKRIIHKACVKDRIVHQLVYDYLENIFEKKFIYDSYASREKKGTHRAVKRLQLFCDRTYGNNANKCWVLKCDIRKFFDSVDHDILQRLIQKSVKEKAVLDLIKMIIDSYETESGKGLPLGNLTSQIFANIYLHVFDHYVKHHLRIENYIRFSDDFVVVSNDKHYLQRICMAFQQFFATQLHLQLPDEKTSLREYSRGVDFLGYIVLPGAILLRTKTRKRLTRKIEEKIKKRARSEYSYTKLCQTVNSYLGLVRICRSFKLRQKILNMQK